jgi:hypothetical protein
MSVPMLGKARLLLVEYIDICARQDKTDWVDNHFLVVFWLPDTIPELLAHSKTDTHRNTDYQGSHQNLDDDAVSLAEVAETVARPATILGVLCLPPPVVCTRPDLAIWSASRGLSRYWYSMATVGVVGDDGLDIGIEWVGVSCGRGRDV